MCVLHFDIKNLKKEVFTRVRKSGNRATYKLYKINVLTNWNSASVYIYKSSMFVYQPIHRPRLLPIKTMVYVLRTR